MIYQLTEPTAVRGIITMIAKRPEAFEVPIDVISKYIINSIDDPFSLILLDEVDGDVRGFAYISIEEFNGEDVAFIHSCIVEPSQKNTVYEFIARTKKWARTKNVKKLVCVEDARIKAFMRKYKFKNMGTILGLDLNEETDNE